ncbi:MAG: CsbD family protein [Anaerolineae bacterium]|nr:CsbD family protein [Anaerolineae bacterium]
MANTNTAPVWDKVSGAWTQFRGEVRKQWGKLTDDDIQQIKGQRDILVGKIQQAYGVAKEEANRQIDEWADNLKF